MKQIISFILASSCIIAAASCSKSEISDIGSPKKEAPNLITCTFANNDAATRTTVDTDGLTPMWAAGDEIMLYDGSSKTQKLTLALSGTASSTEGIIDGTDATKFTFAKPSGWTSVYAIYPSSACVSDFSASAPKINFAGQDGTFAKANICAGKVKDNAISFKNVGAILKFSSKAASVTDILIPVTGSANDYTLSFNDITPSLSSVSAANSRSYSIGDGTGTVYVGVPAATLPSGSSFIYQSSSKSILGSVATQSAITIEENKIYTMPVSIAPNGTIPTGMLSGAFSVSATKKVYFSKGNLLCNTTANPVEWHLESIQTACPDLWNSGHVGHFFWSNTVSIAYADNYSDGLASLNDNYFCSEYNPLNLNNQSGFFVLSTNEMNYLLNPDCITYKYRQDANRFAKARINDFNGLIIFPDGYNDGTPLSDVTGLMPVNKGSVSFPSDNVKDWTLMESAGCVFLPADGYRDGTKIYAVGTGGNYWTSTADCDDIECATMLVFSSYVKPYYIANRNTGYPVRLVYPAQ